ncbi:MAG: hypothetical protein A2Z27_02935 [candidate division Zixibacteria bacterium RBG_16_50_21]|nr:MAG: hypothetical protein A2Z27_02935 [candidate division Zixibacteria bacterium RBG_16_50_21]
MPKHKILVGTSGFSFPDWVGTVYPANIKKEEMLTNYQEHLKMETVEINSTYYSLIRQKTIENMMNRTGPEFKFAVKAYKGITHEFTGKDQDERIRDIENFRFTIAPLSQSHKLIAVLLQFPYSFRPGQKSLDYLLFLRDKFPEELVVEFRNIAWHKDNYYEFLKKNNLGYCVVDEPKLKGLLPFNPIATSETGYFRFHGRNQEWFDSSSVSERYNYDYSDQELQYFVRFVKGLSGKVSLLTTFFNNCHLGAALRNAQRFKQLLSDAGQ